MSVVISKQLIRLIPKGYLTMKKHESCEKYIERLANLGIPPPQVLERKNAWGRSLPLTLAPRTASKKKANTEQPIQFGDGSFDDILKNLDADSPEDAQPDEFAQQS